MNIFNIFNKNKKTEKAETAVEATGAVKPADSLAVSADGRNFVEGLVSTKDIIAPGALEVDMDFIRIGSMYYRTVFTTINRRFVEVNWLSTLINFDASQTVSMYIYPSDGREILDDLRRKITEMEAELTTDIQRGRVVNPSTQAKLEDALNLQADLVKGEERFFQMGLYITLSADNKEDLDRISKNLESAMGALMVLTKRASYQAEDGFITTLPLGVDKLNMTRNMDTTSLATTFPFVSSDLSDDKGIMYGINEHNGSLVIFDRFSMQNYNSVVFATAGAGKSYMIKLEALRSLMMGTEIIVIDPENEYRDLSDSVGGQYIAFGYGEASKINPFDLSLVVDEGENALNSKILTLHKLFKIMLGEMDPIEESILDRAIMDAYKMKGITPDPESQSREAPLIEDLYKSLIGMEDQKAAGLAARMEKYIKGSFAGIFNQKTTVDLRNEFVVFGVKNLEETLRPVAMHIILDYIWTIVKKELRRRILVVDEAWYLMQYPDSASFLRGIVKRGRKYYLGVTTITQDVDDFLQTPYGKEIVTNSAIQILLKQHSAAIDQVGEVFYLSEGEKQLLLSADKGEGIFFAGQNHVAIRVVASEDEHKIITSNPEEIMKMKQKVKLLQQEKIKNGTQEPKLAVKTELPIIEEDFKSSPEVETVLPTAVTPTPEEVKMESDRLAGTVENEGEEENKTLEKAVGSDSGPTEESKRQVYETVVGENDIAEPKIDEASGFLQKKIEEMEKIEKLKVDEHKKKVENEISEAQKAEEEEKKRAGSLGGLGGGLPKYKDLFVNKGNLPPLPPLPKFEAPKVETVPVTNNGAGKALFVNQVKETNIPQPPQLSKKPNPVFETAGKPQNQAEQPKEVTKPAVEENKGEENKEVTVKKPVTPAEASKDGVNQTTPAMPGEDKSKMDYDKLFGNGIV